MALIMAAIRKWYGDVSGKWPGAVTHRQSVGGLNVGPTRYNTLTSQERAVSEGKGTERPFPGRYGGF